MQDIRTMDLAAEQSEAAKLAHAQSAALRERAVVWKEACPDAEVHGIDVGAPQVRCAHARAEAPDFEVALAEAGFPPENFFRGSREPVCLKGQLPPITPVGSVHV